MTTDPQSPNQSSSTEQPAEAVDTAAAETPPTADAPAAAPEPPSQVADQATSQPSGTAAPTAQAPAASGGPLAAKVRSSAGPLAARGLGVAKPASPTVSAEDLAGTIDKPKPPPKKKKHKVKPSGVVGDKSERPKQPKSKVAVPSLRHDLADDLQAELEAELAAADFDSLMTGSVGMPDRKEAIAEGDRVHGQVIKIHSDSVYVSLGGPDQGVIPFEQFTAEEPVPGQSIEVQVRGLNSEDGLYALTLPGATIAAADWGDIDEGSVVEASITGHNTGGLECKVGGIKGFIPISQIAEYRVEDLSEFVDQKFVCIVTEANMGRGNLVLSRRAVLEREREEKRQAQLEELEPGQVVDGVVRSLKDFGAFVDLGGCDGLIHISKLSWERVKHPSEVLEVGQKVSVQIDTINKETGKIGLTFRDLQDNPWDTAEAEFAVGSTHKGDVTRIANFGCFVRLAAGVEGLVHISEIAHHRVTRVDTVVSEGEQVEVKVLSFDREAQKIGLSIKAAQQAPADAKSSKVEEEVDEPQREPVIKATHTGPLKGGNNRDTGGEQFGLRW